MKRPLDTDQIVTACLIGLTMLVFFPTVQNGFTNWDDGYHVVNNPQIRSLDWESVRAMFTSFTVAHYIPLVSLTFAVEYHLFGLDPFVFHFTNLLLHVIATLLVYTLARRWDCSTGEAFIAALLFGIHPLHVEPVAWISARKDVLAGVFLLAALLTFQSSEESGRRDKYLLSLLLYLCSLGAKSAGMFLPLFLAAQWFLQGPRDRRALLRIVPFGLLAAGAGVLTLAAHTDAGALHLGLRHSTAESFLIACYNILFYTFKTLVPLGLSSVYPFPNNSSSSLPFLFFVSPLVVAAALWGIYSFRRSAGMYVVPLAFFLTGLLPTLQLVPFGSMIAADRFAYLPSAGMLVAVILALSAVVRRRPELRNASLALLVIVVGMFAWTTWNRVGVWQNSETLWSDAIRQYPEFPISYYSRGQFYFSAGREEEALADFTMALKFAPEYPAALNMRGYMNAVRGNTAEARADFDHVLALQPDNAMAYYNNGLLHHTAGALDSAYADLTSAIDRDPLFTEAFVRRGEVLLALGKWEEAVHDLSSALHQQPDHSEALTLRGSALFNLSRLDEAEEDLRRAVKIDPENSEGFRLLAALSRRRGEADTSMSRPDRSKH
ncbi:MAG: tetratricopeptide repeat protein [Bacteroidetes bacterium]|nr:tetratricopeptide repeat protein [Bacteroidota bacterium]